MDAPRPARPRPPDAMTTPATLARATAAVAAGHLALALLAA